MSDLDVDAADAIEARLEAWPPPPELPDATLERFFRERRRIHQRHNEWRRGMPALDDLFENDEHRAKALAGSLATELDRVFEAHGDLTEDASVGSAWPRVWAEAWQQEARGYIAAWNWEAESAEMFELVLSDLCGQSVERAEQGDRPRAARPEVELSAVQRMAMRAGRLARRFFRPQPGRR